MTTVPRKAAYLAVLAVSVAGCAALATTARAQLRANRRPPRPEVTLPDGPVRQVILKSCSQCHGIDEYGFYAMDREHWAAVIERMKTAKSGVVEGAKISDADREILLAWLVAEFGPDSTPMPRRYVVRELDESEKLDGAAATATLEAACNDCHTLERIERAELGPEEWRERLTQEVGRGARLLIQNVEPLVQWLAER
jgi:cytochrome c2